MLAPMPELPEVETIRRQLAPIVEGRRLWRVEVCDPRWSAPLAPDELADALRGRRIEQLGRRGKYLLWHLSDDVHLAQHLRMTGTVLCDPDPEPAHVSARFDLDNGRRLLVADPRRFGTAQLFLGADALEGFLAAKLGLEPLDEAFTAAHLAALARGRSAPVKAFLLDQRRMAGIGNIYADEALHRAAIHPQRPAGSLTAEEHERLREALVWALQAGIEARGATIGDFRHVDGVWGSFQDRFQVHRRAGEPCLGCGTLIEKLTVAGRGTYVCRSCQRPPRAKKRARVAGQSEGGAAALRPRAARRSGRSRPR